MFWYIWKLKVDVENRKVMVVDKEFFGPYGTKRADEVGDEREDLI